MGLRFVGWVAVGALFLAGLTAGCGGGGGGDPAPSIDGPQTQIVRATQGMDGWCEETGQPHNGDGLLVGDVDKLPGIGVGARGLISFSLLGIPAGATIESATLDLYQVWVEGDPLSNHGVVVAFHADYGDSLTAGDYTCPVLPSTVVIVSDSAALGRRTVDVTEHVLADRAANRTRTQFRLEFNILDSDVDSTPDFIQFDDAESSQGSGEPARLRVTYRP